jgi:hypothetical protein
MGAMEGSCWAQLCSNLTLAALVIGHHLAISAFCHVPSGLRRSTIASGNLQPRVIKLLTPCRIVECLDGSGVEPDHDLLRRRACPP